MSSEDAPSQQVTRETVLRIVLSCLLDNGWTTSPGFGSHVFAIKPHQTAVGMRQASAYLSMGDSYNYTINGDYQSEGRNCLEAHGVLVPKSADEAEILRLALKFSEGADMAVSQTYAARLYASSKVAESGEVASTASPQP